MFLALSNMTLPWWVNADCSWLMTSMSFAWLGMISRICSFTSPGFEKRLTGPPLALVLKLASSLHVHLYIPLGSMELYFPEVFAVLILFHQGYNICYYLLIVQTLYYRKKIDENVYLLPIFPWNSMSFSYIHWFLNYYSQPAIRRVVTWLPATSSWFTFLYFL